MHSFFLFLSLLSLQAMATEATFQRAVILSGDNINSAAFLGMLDATEDMGKPVDIVIGSCGGSIPAAVINAIPNRWGRYNFIKSLEFYTLLKNLRVNDVSLPDFANRLLHIRRIAADNEKILESSDLSSLQRTIPSIFDFSLVLAGDVFEKIKSVDLNVPFSNNGIRAVIVSAKAEFAPQEAGQLAPASRKLFKEVYFTDEDTARYLNNFPSFVGSHFPNSAIELSTETITNVSLAKAVRASISDPLLVLPEDINGVYYVTGAVNIDPINVARRLANEVVDRYPIGYSATIETPALMSTFGFDGNTVRKIALNLPVEYFSDMTGKYPNMTPGARSNFLSFNPARSYKFGFGIPDTYEDFLKLVKAQYSYGYAKTMEALQQPKFSKAHIKNLLN